jgi:1-acyl-sn-glycerol-3-phosphate acyltransferase
MLWMSYFLVSIAVLGLFLAFGLCAPFYLLGRHWRPVTSVADQIMQKGIWLLLRLQPWLTLHGKLPADLKGKLLIANHRSHLDVFLFLAQVPGVRILAKDSLFKIPFLGTMMSLSRQIPVTRGNMNSYMASLETVKHYLSEKETVLIFPEMTRSLSGLQEFRLAPFKMAKDAGASIVPIAISGSEKLWPSGRFKLNSGSVTLTSLPEVKAAEFSKSEELSEYIHGRLVKELQ